MDFFLILQQCSAAISRFEENFLLEDFELCAGVWCLCSGHRYPSWLVLVDQRTRLLCLQAEHVIALLKDVKLVWQALPLTPIPFVCHAVGVIVILGEGVWFALIGRSLPWRLT